MANITISVQSMLNSAVYDSYTVSDTTTVDNFKLTIQSNTGFDPSWFNLCSGTTVLEGTDTLAAAGVIEGSLLRTANVISRLPTRESRQKAKLALAELDRTASGNARTTYDLSELPTQYSGNTVVDNPNVGGLIEGRPWS